jgi:predicted dinucleotide-binding enzyme
MIGAGAVGGFVGGRLAQASREVDFLVRPGRAAELNQHGLRIVDSAHTEVIDAHPVTASSLAGHYDLVLVAVKAQALPRRSRTSRRPSARTPSSCRSSTASTTSTHSPAPSAAPRYSAAR